MSVINKMLRDLDRPELSRIAPRCRCCSGFPRTCVRLDAGHVERGHTSA